MWTEQEAREKLTEVLQRAEAGEPQFVGDSGVLISRAEYSRLIAHRNAPHLGRWLIENAPRIGDIDLPPRHSDRPVPFDDWSDEEIGE
jgi:antitoxin (DNA-binding transcriptional repressor) of toxin-antitoxin stability system